MIILGTKAKTTTIKTGMFLCPQCRTERRYALKRAKKYFSLYFIPIIPMGDLGEFVECRTCGGTFKPVVLQMNRAEPQSIIARYLNTIKRRIDQGHPLEYMIRDLTADGLDRDTANNLVNSIAGVGRKQCPQCELTYAYATTTCQECESDLVVEQSRS